MRQNRDNYRRASGKHTAKTPAEKELYNEKVKHAEFEGVTSEQPPNKSSTLSPRSVYSGSYNAGIADRNPIKPPLRIDKEKSRGTLATIGALLTILSIFGGGIYWVTTLKNQVDFNETQLGKLEISTKELGTKQEDFNIRIAKLEQWKNLVDDDLKAIKEDIKKGVSTKQIEMRLIELEGRVFKESAKN